MKSLEVSEIQQAHSAREFIARCNAVRDLVQARADQMFAKHEAILRGLLQQDQGHDGDAEHCQWRDSVPKFMATCSAQITAMESLAGGASAHRALAMATQVLTECLEDFDEDQ